MVPSAPRVVVWSHSKSDVASHKETEGIGAPGQFPRIVQLHGTWGMKVLRCRPAPNPVSTGTSRTRLLFHLSIPIILPHPPPACQADIQADIWTERGGHGSGHARPAPPARARVFPWGLPRVPKQSGVYILRSVQE